MLPDVAGRVQTLPAMFFPRIPCNRQESVSCNSFASVCVFSLRHSQQPMKSTQSFTVSTVTVARFRLPSLRALSLACMAGGIALVSATSLRAKPVPSNLGNGLDRIIESDLALQEARATNKTVQTFASASGKTYVNAETAALANLALGDEQGRLLVRINPDGTKDVKELRRSLAATFSSLTVTAVDKAYRGVGVMNAYVATEEVAALAQFKGVRSVILELKPRHAKSAFPTVGNPDVQPNATAGDVFPKLGTAFDQGVTQHRVDTINKFYNPNATLDYQGAGITIGMLSDSYNTAYAAGNTNAAAAGVTRFDLPGASNNPVNTQPVVVLQDFPGGTDEGRGMIEIGYKMAPKARLGFASADYGEVGFANNIRALAGIPGTPNVVSGFSADVICDDVGYFDEPYFQDGIIGGGVDDAAAFGVSYFSSAANDIGVNGYDSDLRWTANGTGTTAAAGNTALANTNIDLTGVPTNLYAGGFHNFNPNGLDVAQTVNIASNANQPPTVLQWNEPYDQNTTPNLVQPPVFTGNGTITTTATTVTFSGIALNAGTLYEIDANAATGSSVDVTVTVTDPNGNVIISQDNTVDEVVRFFAPTTGNYTITIGRFQTTTGAFNVTVYATTGYTGQTIATDVNLLVFNLATGAYIGSSSLTANNFATNQPIELGVTARPTGATQVQYVIARGNVPANGGATHVRYLIPGNGLGGIGPAEYFTYNTVTTGGHAMAQGCNGAAAYSVFRPNIPESFTSPGPVMIYFDKQGNRLATPEVRLQPRIAAADAGNTSFFSGDVNTDQDTSPNFSGTSAAAPHAAAIAALVLQAKGGPRSVTPTQMTSLLQRSTFPHDLDPSFSSGSARVTGGTTGTGKVTITVNSDQSTNGGTGGNDNNSIAISYVGGSAITSFVFNPGGTSATAGNTTGGNNGVTYNATGTGGTTATYFENNFPGMVFNTVVKPFTVGSASTVAAANVTAAQSNLAGTPSTTQGYTLTLTFTGGTFTGGNTLRCNVGRQIQHSAVTGNVNTTIGLGTTVTNYSADLLGATIAIPSGTVVSGGAMTFSGTTADGGKFSGTINNRIGAGYSTVDGYGFINAQTAVTQTVQ